MDRMKYPKIKNPRNYDGNVAEDFKGVCYFQEKVDGSNFRVWIEDGQFKFGSRNNILDPISSDNFKPAIAHFMNNLYWLEEKLPQDIIMFFEFLEKPKHNTVEYDRVPTNHLMLIDAYYYDREVWLRPDELVILAETLNVEPPNTLDCKYVVGITDLYSIVEELINKPSVLGGKMEGVVVKNYDNFKTENGVKAYKGLKIYRDRILKKEDYIPVDINTKWVDSLVDPNFIDKIITKFKDEGRDLKLKDLINYAYSDFILENSDYMQQTVLDHLTREIAKYLKHKFFLSFKDKNEVHK